MIKIMLKKKWEENQNAWDRLLRSKDMRYEEREKEFQKEKAFLIKDLQQIFEKSSKIQIQKDRTNGFSRFRLLLEVPEKMIRDVYQWGNDNKMIDYFGTYIGEISKRKIFEINTLR